MAQTMRSAACLGVVAGCADARSVRMTSWGGRVNKASRTRGSRRAADRSRRRSVTGRARSLRSRFALHLDQSRADEPLEKGQQVAFQAIGGNVVLREETLVNRADRDRLGQERPDVSAGRVKAVVGPGGEVEDGRLSA